MEMPLEEYKISVVVPVYNSEKYLDRCVDSLLSQTHPNMEIILVDDGSTDSSGKICDRYAGENAGIKVFHKENGGSSSARNLGIRNATGDYVGFCDSDDYTEPDMYELLLKAATENGNADIVQIQTCYHSESGELLKGPADDSGKVTFIPSEEDFRLLMLHVGDASFCTKIIRRDFLKKYAFSEGRLNEDFELVIRMIQDTKGVYKVGKAGYHIVLSDYSNTRGTFKTEFYDAMIQNSDMAYELALTKYPSAVTEAERFRLFQRLDYMLHIPVEKMKDNAVCDGIIRFLKEHRKEIDSNPFLSAKEKRNLKILAAAPYLSKRTHRLIMKIKKPGKTRVYEGAVMPEGEGKND